jgi:hypothetical protein
MAINISNPKGRDAVVAFEAVMPKREVIFVDAKNKPVITQKLLKTDVEHDLPVLLKKKKNNLNALAKALVKEDPEIDLEEFGMFLTDTSRVYVSKKGIIHLVDEFEVISNPDGTLRERRPRQKEPQNINTDIPLRWTGKFIKKDEAAHKFIFTLKRQLIHVNGLTFDFLYEMAKELDERDSLLLVRGGEKGDKPIVMHRGGRPYNAFLEGRVKGDSYLLVLQLSNMELKRPKAIEEETATDVDAAESTDTPPTKEPKQKKAIALAAAEESQELKEENKKASKKAKPEKTAAPKKPEKKAGKKPAKSTKKEDKKPAKKKTTKKK